jgi:hypothetical protein
MKNKILFWSTLLVYNVAFAQYGYWQQKVEYTMDIDFDDSKHQYTGKQKLVYYNNSPDTLHKVFFHLYFNAFQPGSSMDVQSRQIADPDKRVGDRISKLTPAEIGYQNITALKKDGKDQKFEVQGTILEVNLTSPIKPNSKVVFELEFNAQVPVQIRRSGRNSKEGIDYSMTQWYPKICEYDYQGWHADPYVGREFYGVFGSFDVTIHLNKKYVVAATGTIQNPQEVGAGYEDKTKPLKLSAADKKTWHFMAQDVHDFAWAADPDYNHDTQQVPNGPLVHFFFQSDDSFKNWKEIQPVMVKFFQLMETRFGKYPYAGFSYVQGGDGGMEYPTMTLVTSAGGSLDGLIGVCLHEAIHNWFYGVLATNESKYGWMDEGFTQYATNVMEDIIYDAKSPNPQEWEYTGYRRLYKNGYMEPMTTHSDHYKRNGAYSTSAYSRGAVFLQQLKYIIGETAFNKGMLAYFNNWKFKHPQPYDFIRVMEKTSGLELDWYLDLYIGTLQVTDYSVAAVYEKNGKTCVQFNRIGDLPMPLDVAVETTSGTQYHYIPLDLMRGNKTAEGSNNQEIQIHADWPWVYRSYTLELNVPLGAVKKITIDPSTWMADVEPLDNVWPAVQQGSNFVEPK